MKRYIGIRLIFLTMTSWLFMQECPPIDTLSINPTQNMWNIPVENQWDGIEVMTWNIKDFPISNNTVNYVNEIITDILPDIIAFQEINDINAYNTLVNSLSAYEFVTSGSGLALAVRLDVIEITSMSTMFPNSGHEFAWRYPLLVELDWLCGAHAASLQIINIHLKSGSSNDDFDRRFASCELLSSYINQHLNVNIIVLGDYNDEITDTENSNSLWPLVLDDAVAFATEPIADNDYYASYPSWPSFIDHIAISEPLFDKLSEGNIKTIRIDDYTGYSFFQNYISDHRPVLWSFPIEEIELTTDLVINEIMQNPSIVTDAAGEWIEITNISNSMINLNGLILLDNDGEEHIISDNNLVVYPGEFVILGANEDSSINGGVIVDYEYSDYTLSNFFDEVILAHPSGIIIDEIHYDNGDTFPDEEGASMMLLDPTLDNSLGENWETANMVFGTGDFGTPGQDNNYCSELIGDVNGDGDYNVLDVVLLANCILATTCDEGDCAGDVNGDGNYNVLDVVLLTNCILADNCSG